MFKFLKEKLGSVVKKFSKEVEEEAESIEVKDSVEQSSSNFHEREKELKEIKQEVKEIKEKPVIVKEKPKKEEKETKKEIKEVKTEVKKDKEEKKHEGKHLNIKYHDYHEEKQKEHKHKEVEKPKVEEKKSESKPEVKPLEIKKEKEKKAEKEESVEIKEVEDKPKKGFFSKLFKKEKHVEEEQEQIKEQELIEEVEEKLEQQSEIKAEEELGVELEIIEDEEVEKEELEKPEKKGFFTKITETFTKINLSEDKFEELFWDLEVMLLENNVAVEVIQKIKDDLKKELMSDKISRKNVDEIIKDSLKQSLEEILDIKGFDLDDKIKHKKPYIIAVIGVNGSGKTTTIAKLCHLLKKKGHTVVLAAADTFRAAAIQQLEHHAEKLEVKMIKHDYNSDPAAVAFDAIKHAEAKKIDVVVIDTAGRLHSNDNLMNELKKLIKVNKPDLKLFVGESITGNDCVEQAKVYDEIIGIDAIILSKADIDEKGGAALSISYVTKKPVLFVGTGQTYDDLKPFDKKEIMEGLGF